MGFDFPLTAVKPACVTLFQTFTTFTLPCFRQSPPSHCLVSDSHHLHIALFQTFTILMWPCFRHSLHTMPRFRCSSPSRCLVSYVHLSITFTLPCFICSPPLRCLVLDIHLPHVALFHMFTTLTLPCFRPSSPSCCLVSDVHHPDCDKEEWGKHRSVWLLRLVSLLLNPPAPCRHCSLRLRRRHCSAVVP